MVNCIYNGSVEAEDPARQELAEPYKRVDGRDPFCTLGLQGNHRASSLIKNSLENAGLPTMVLDGDGYNPTNSSDGQVSHDFRHILRMLSEGKEGKKS